MMHLPLAQADLAPEHHLFLSDVYRIDDENSPHLVILDCNEVDPTVASTSRQIPVDHTSTYRSAVSFPVP
jgi:hypothetical protein